MADQATAQAAPFHPPLPAEKPPGAALVPSWHGLWRMPVILTSSALLVAAIVQGGRAATPVEFTTVLRDVESDIEAGRLDSAFAELAGRIAAAIKGSSRKERGRLHLVAADTLLAALERAECRNSTLLERGVYHALRAEESGVPLTSEQMSRVGTAEFALGRAETARVRLRRLEALAADPLLAEEARAARDGLLRAMISTAVRAQGVAEESALELIALYLEGEQRTPQERARASAGAAEVMLRAGQARGALDEASAALAALGSQSSAADRGRLHALRGRALHELGEFDAAERECHIAITLLDSSDVRRAEAMLALGWILVEQGRHEEALDVFELVQREDGDGPIHPGALLGRAHVLGETGEHQLCLDDFRKLAAQVSHETSEDLSIAHRAVDLLAERRHDGALAAGDPLLALGYINLVCEFFEFEALPPNLLERLASTRRLCAEAVAADASTRRARYHEAAGAYLALAQQLRGDFEIEDRWSMALLQAGDCFDHAGDDERAIAAFEQVRLWHTLDESQGLQAAAREARCHVAAGRAADAAELYQQIIERNPDHPMASACHAPLAQCFILLSQPALGEQELLKVVSGRTALTPASLEFVEARIALADLYYCAGRFREAVEQYSAAIDQTPLDPRSADLRLRLAESCLANAEEIANAIDSGRIPESEAPSSHSLRERQLRDAMCGFIALIDESAESPSRDDVASARRLRAQEGAAACSMQLGDFEAAIHHLETIASCEGGSSGGVVALIQVSSCHLAAGDVEAARRARLRAAEVAGLAPVGAPNETALLRESGSHRWMRAAIWPDDPNSSSE